MVISEALKAIKAITPYKCPHLVVVWLVEWVKGCEWLMGLFSGGEGVKKGVGQGPVGSTNRGEIKQLLEVCTAS